MEKYLAETDWYVIRYLESGKEIPKDVFEKRRKARKEISEINEQYFL